MDGGLVVVVVVVVVAINPNGFFLA